ncbi:MAG: toprim domain-containing protein [Candidatus Aenigmarchaeota archaeon]|nr:toprim domain-containing protein [Candidatus Aenigmarchaeota archaeon]
MERRHPPSEEADRVLGDLREAVVVVEGTRDRLALEGLGMSRIVPLNGRSLANVAEELARLRPPEVVILTDFDREGRALHARLRTLLARYGVRANPRLRHMVRQFGWTRIEDMTADAIVLHDKKRGDTHGKARAHIDQIHHSGTDHGQRRDREA